MNDFLRQYSIKTNKKRVNDKLIRRTYERPLYKYIVDCCKNLEVLPPIKLESWKLITDQTKINVTLNKRLNKDPKIKNNKTLESLVHVNDSVTDMLELNFSITIKGCTKHVTRRMLVLKPLPGNYYVLGGKKVLPINQIVDNSTFVKGNILKFKTTLFAIDIDTHKCNLTFTDGTSIKAPYFEIDLFSKVCNPLLYFFARYGVDDTLELFNLESVMSLVPYQFDKKRFYYLKVEDNLYVEILKDALTAHEFIPRFLSTFYHAIKGASSHKVKNILDKEFWLTELGAVFAKRTVNKGQKVLISFSKIMDPSTAKRLALPKMHRKNSHMLIRWLLTNYTELIKKDNHNLRFKRVRANECIAYYFDAYITRNVNSLLNSDSAQMDRYEKLLNAINEDTLFKAIRSNKANPYSLFRYESYNCLDVVNSLRWSVKGVSGLNGGKHGTSLLYRDIYPSHIGRLDMNVCSASDPGLTGYLSCNCQVDDRGYFGGKDSEPDCYDPVIDKKLEKIAIKNYAKKRADIMMMEYNRGEDGFIKLQRIPTALELNLAFQANPEKYGLYALSDGLHLIPKGDTDNKGFMKLELLPGASMDPKAVTDRDKDGFIKLTRIRDTLSYD